MNKFLRTTALSLTVIMLLSLLTGCKSSKDVNSNADNSKQTESTNTLPLVTKPTEISIWQQNYQTKLIKDYGEIQAHQELEKRTGVKIKWIHPTSTDPTAINEQFNLMIASNDLPDIIFNNWGTTLSKYIDDKVIIKLNDLIDKNAPDIKKKLLEDKDIKQQMILDDGTIAMFPQVTKDLGNVYRGFLMRKDWLDKSNLKVPTTIDEWYTVLKAFKEKDPNGNGKADEIPLSDEKGPGLENFAEAWGVKANKGLGSFGVDPKTGKIQYGPLQPAYKDFIGTMAKWYKEGLIDSEYALVDRKVIDSKVLSNTVGALWGTNSSYMSVYLNLMKDKDPNFNMVGVPFPIGPAGKAYDTFDSNIMHVPGYGGAITTKCKDPVLVTKLCNYFYSDEGDTLLNWGVEGSSYTVENGKKKWTDAIMKSPDGKTPSEAVVKFVNINNGWMRIIDPTASFDTYPKQYYDARDTWAKADRTLLLPILTLTADENQKFTNIMSEINTYSDTMYHKFLQGKEPIEKYDDYVNQLKKMGILDALKIEQDAYDRYNARK